MSGEYFAGMSKGSAEAIAWLLRALSRLPYTFRWMIEKAWAEPDSSAISGSELTAERWRNLPRPNLLVLADALEKPVEIPKAVPDLTKVPSHLLAAEIARREFKYTSGKNATMLCIQDHLVPSSLTGWMRYQFTTITSEDQDNQLRAVSPPVPPAESADTPVAESPNVALGSFDESAVLDYVTTDLGYMVYEGEAEMADHLNNCSGFLVFDDASDVVEFVSEGLGMLVFDTSSDVDNYVVENNSPTDLFSAEGCLDDITHEDICEFVSRDIPMSTLVDYLSADDAEDLFSRAVDSDTVKAYCVENIRLRDIWNAYADSGWPADKGDLSRIQHGILVGKNQLPVGGFRILKSHSQHCEIPPITPLRVKLGDCQGMG